MRLQLTRRGDYAVRAMLLLARDPGRTCSSAAIASATQIPVRFVGQVMGALVHAGLVEARIGRHGGYFLGRPAESVSLLDIVEAVEGPTRRRTCVLRGGACAISGVCEVHEFFGAAQEALLGRLAASPLSAVLGS